MKNKGVQITIAMICIVLGLMLGVQFKSVKTNNATNVGQSRSEEAQIRLKEMSSKLEETEKKLKEYQDAALKDNNTTQVVKKDIEQLKMAAGMVAARGAGIIITVDDNTSASKTLGQLGQYVENYIVHDKDIQVLVNELRAIGAEAISVNGQRLVSKSEIRCVGPTISINNTKVAVPFEIKAIGNPDSLENSLTMPGGVIESWFEPYLKVKIKKQNDITVPKYDGIYKFEYAQPVKEEDVVK
jgi:uncharacterized protein YlxW (UPF0749 family)